MLAPEPITETAEGTATLDQIMQPPGWYSTVPAEPIAAVPPELLIPSVFEACALQIDR